MATKIYNVAVELTFSSSGSCGRQRYAMAFRYYLNAGVTICNKSRQGTTGLEKHVDTLMDNCRLFTELIRQRPGFELVIEPEFANVCFWYVPPNLRNVQNGEKWRNVKNYEKLHKVFNTTKMVRISTH